MPRKKEGPTKKAESIHTDTDALDLPCVEKKNHSMRLLADDRLTVSFYCIHCLLIISLEK